MDWADDGIVLAARPHGESSAILTLLTRGHGRHAGLVRGGWSRRMRGLLEPGNRVQATWRARLPEHLGNYTCEPAGSMAVLLDAPTRLAALTSAAAVSELALPEREPHPQAFDGFERLLAVLRSAPGELEWQAAYVRWEMNLLAEIGFGLDLARCAASGAVENLAYVSPKSGRAVSAAVGAPYRTRLLPLPAFLAGSGLADGGAILDGLRLTGHFLDQHVFVHPTG